MKPLCIDLFCGYGGWTRGFLDAGYDVIGFDIEPECRKQYPVAAQFNVADVRDLDGCAFQQAHVIVASPPCQEFSDLRFLRKNPKQPDMSLVNAVYRIRKESGRPTIIENVRGARRYFPEKAVCNRGAYYLWGDVPLFWKLPVPMKVGAVARARAPDGSLKPSRERQWGRAKLDKSQEGARRRAIIPYLLSRTIAEMCLVQYPMPDASRINR